MLILSAALAATVSCMPIAGPRITAHDLALADPRFSAIAGTQFIGFAPEPGIRRTFATAELERIAQRHGIATDSLKEICFEVPMLDLTLTSVREAMRTALPPAAELTILEASASEVPAGTLQFPLSALEPVTSDGSQIWRGYVQYAATKKMHVWARVRVTHHVEAIVAVRDIPANTVIEASSISRELRSVALSKELPATQAAGFLTRKAIPAGSVVSASSIEPAAVVKRGESIRVEVHSGSTHLLFDAVAERSGRDGEIIDLRNPATGKLFRARLTGNRAVIRL